MIFCRKPNLGETLNDILKLKENTRREAISAQNKYTNCAIKLGKQIANQLDKQLSRLDSDDSDIVDIADCIFEILVDNNSLKSFEELKNKFDLRQDANDVINAKL